LIIIDELNTEINRLHPDKELLEENAKLVKTCEKLHLKCHMLEKEINLRDEKNEIYQSKKFINY